MGTSIDDLRIEGRLREVLVGENPSGTRQLDPDDHVTAARDEVVRYVDAVSEKRHALDLTLSTLVRDPTIAALLMAKVATANERRVELTISEESGLERLEPADAADVATVLGNLVDNALEHAPRGTASAPWVRVRVRQDQTSVEIVVTDSGPGIPDDLVRTVFEHGVTTKRVDPLEHGVGLALTRLVCRRRGGEIHVEREDGATSFVARLGVSTVTDPVAAESFS